MECILKVQGKGSPLIEGHLKRISSFIGNNHVILLTDLSEFQVKSGTSLNIFDLNSRSNLGKVKFIEVHLPRDMVWNSIEEGHRAVGVYELTEGTDLAALDSMAILDRLTAVDDRFFLYSGDFQKLYNKYYNWEGKSGVPPQE